MSPTKDAHSSSVAIEFLKRFDPKGRHNLVAIHPETKAVQGHTFEPGEWDRMDSWIAEYPDWNHYFTVNEPRAGAPHKKLKKEDIERIRAVYVDVDPSAEVEKQEGGTERERRRIAGLMDELAADPHFAPSAIVDSGGGYQAFWRLSEKLDVDAHARWAENQGRALAKRFGGDAVQNIERIMRLPGTRNIPNAQKKARGRKPATSRLIAFGGATYGPEELRKFVAPIDGGPKTDNAAAIAQLMRALPMDEIRSASLLSDLPAALQKAFSAARERDPGLASLWDGDPDAVLGEDHTGSGYCQSLARRLRAHGFTGDDFGRLVWVWDHAVSNGADRYNKITARSIARDWIRMAQYGAPIPAEGVFVDPNSPGPEPIDLWADDRDPPDLARGILPPDLERWVADEADRKGVQLGAFAVPALVTCASAIAAGFRVQVTQADTKYTERAILWGAIVGHPGARKSPVIDAALEPIKAIEAGWAAENATKRRAYEEEHAAWKKAVRAGTAGPEPQPPIPRRKLIDDASPESMLSILAGNPHGLYLTQDELAQLAGSMDAYRPGKSAVSRDQSLFLRMKGGGPYIVDRISRGTQHVPVSAVHIVGAIQPEVIRKLAQDWGGNGMMQRFLLVNMPKARLVHGQAPDANAYETIASALRLMMSLQDTSFTPVFRFESGADAIRRRVAQFAHDLLGSPDLPLPLQGWLEKLQGEWARISLVFHFVDWATGPGAVEASLFPDEEVSVETAERAARFLLEFQYPQQVHFYRHVAGLSAAEDQEGRALGSYILTKESSELSERDVEQIRRHLSGLPKRPQRLAVLDTLERNGWLIPAGRHRDGHINRWRVNPAVHLLFAERAAFERERKAEEAVVMDRAFSAVRSSKAA